MHHARSNPRRPVAFLALMALSATLALTVGVGPQASAQLYGPIPANAAGDPTYDFTDQDSIWTYVRSDIAGGVICIVPASTTVESGSCRGALGGENHLVGIGTLYTLVSGHGLPAGNYRLLVENSVEEPTEVSEAFNVTACPDCPPDPDAAVVAAFKAAAGAMSGPKGNMTMMCELTDVLEKVAGKAVKARGIVKLPDSDDVSALTADSLSFVMTFAGGGFVMYNPLTVNIRKGLDIQKALACAARQMYADQAADPPDPDFGTVAEPVHRDFSPLGPPELDALSTSVEHQRALGVAMLHGYERYQGARDAGNEDAQVRQLRAAGGLAGEQADELAATAAALRTWAGVAEGDEELSGVLLTSAERDEVVAARARVSTEGFSSVELDQLHTLGYSDPDIEIIRAQLDDLSSVPVDTTYADALRQAADGMEQQVQAYRDFGLELLVVAGRIAQQEANEPPTADDVAVTATSGTATTVTLSGADPDGDALTFDVVQQPTHGTLGGAGASRTYTSTAGFTGTDTFTYTVSDPTVSSAPATVTISVQPPSNTGPTAYDGSVTTGQGHPVAVDLLASDPEGDPLTYDVGAPQHGQLSGTAPHLTYTPAPDFVGTDSFRFRVSDGASTSPDALVSIEVRPYLTPRHDDLKADPDGVVDVLQNDGSTTPLAVTSASDGDHGSVSCGPLGGCTYRAANGYTGTDTFTYTLRDQAGRTATAQVRVEVVAPPSGTSAGPSALDDRVATLAGTPVDVDVVANDTGAGQLEVSDETDPPHGTVACSTAGTCRYTPDAGFAGYDGFTYALRDANRTVRASVDVVVAPAGARFDVGISGRPAAPDGPGDVEITQGDNARWGVSVTPQPALSQDEVAALSRPSGSARPEGPHTLIPGSLARSPGWAGGAESLNLSFDALAPAILGSRLTRPVPRPQPPISQGTGGDGHVPILVGSKVFAFFHHSSPTSVTCMDRSTGLLCPGYPRPVWQMGTSNVNGPGAVVNGKIYVHLLPIEVGATESRGVSLFCWDTRSDSTCGLDVLARVPASDFNTSQASAPVLVKGRIYVGAQDGRAYCYDPTTREPCATASAPTGLASGASSLMDIATHGDHIYLSSGAGSVTCLVAPDMARCPGWAAVKELGGTNLVIQHDSAGAPVGVCVIQGSDGRCVSDAGQESTLANVPLNDGYYGITQEGETGRRTFLASLFRGGLGCWDWSTSAPCTGANFDAGGWATGDGSNVSLPSAYGTTWDGSCLVALGDPGQVFTMDVEGNSPCTSLATGSSSLSMDLRDQRCDATVGRASWREVSLLETDPSGTELASVSVRVVDALSGAELLTDDLVGTGRLSLAGIDPVAHPSLRVEAVAVARSGDAAWTDGVPPRVALSWTADPRQMCFTTTTPVDCTQPTLAAILVRASLATSSRVEEAALSVRRSATCTSPPTLTPTPAPTPTPNPDRDGDGLLNTQEAGLGTDPDDPDSDDDALGDGAEVAGMVVQERFEVCGARTKRSITVTTNPLKADTDRDGITDGVEVRGYTIKQRVVISNKGDTYVIGRTRSNPAKADTDRDGLKDEVERTGSANKRWGRHKTDPTKCDTDHGALSDGVEVNHRSDPADFRSGPGDPGTIPMGGGPRIRLQHHLLLG